MPCYHPLTAYRKIGAYNPVTGRWPLTFKKEEGHAFDVVSVPCGQCIGCRLERSRQWAIRCVHEAALHDENTFLTLTYNDTNLPLGGSLNVRDVQLFLKRLRKRFSGNHIRFFQCGEYGELLNRPHHHMIVFGFDFPDKEFWQKRNGCILYRSKELEKLWPFGYSTIGGVTFESAAYVARYITKKITGDNAEEHYQGRSPEYITMSRRPGIGREWAEKYIKDIYPHDYLVIRKGIKARPPRYYDNIYDVIDTDDMQRIKKQRIKKIKENAKEYTEERLNVKEKIQEIKLKRLVRPYEAGV